jgi:hypothetical protein
MGDSHNNTTIVPFVQPTKEEMKELEKYCRCHLCKNNKWVFSGCRVTHGCLKGGFEPEDYFSLRDTIEDTRRYMALKKSERADNNSSYDIARDSKCTVM